MTKNITMYDVAKEAGVSLMTVSRVINKKGEVSPATIQRIQEIINRLGYRPSSIARGLTTKRTCTIGLVVPDITNPFFSGIARGVEQEAYKEEYNVFLCNTNEDPKREIAVLQSLEEKRVDGIVVCSSRLEDGELQEVLLRHHAAVLVNRRLGGNVSSVVLTDDESGGRLATQHLLKTGHQFIGILAGPASSRSGRERIKGYFTAFKSAGLSCDSSLVHLCYPTLEGGKKAAYELLTNYPKVTALFCYNDLVAVGALHACASLNRRIPEDVAIVGFDDIPLATLVIPQLTTCRVHTYELGICALQSLMNRINGSQIEGKETILQPDLIIRASAP